MQKAKIIPEKWTWSDLVPKIEPEPCVLLNGPGENFTLAWDISDDVIFEQEQFDFTILDSFLAAHSGNYVFGYISYDVKNKIESHLKSENGDRVKMPDSHFIAPRHVLVRNENDLRYYGNWSTEELGTFFSRRAQHSSSLEQTSIQLKAQTSREEYETNFKGIKEAIQFGTIYEMNYCLNFFAEEATIHPFETYRKLCDATEAPFSCYFHVGDHYALSGSPERYLKRTTNTILSQPIKGTAARGANAAADEQQKKNLQINEKERAENIMIVDLVRNDLSRIATKNSVQVDELCGVYTFKTVHQLISSISCELKSGISFSEILKATFPMGSMTGAPKISAMKEIERFENFRRGLYSGTIGYIDPDGNFDFNVVIRSILYSAKERVVSCSVGGAITINAEANNEYDECQLKLSALQKALC